MSVKIGDKVGAGRFPGDGRKPWSGTLLAVDSPVAWKGSMAFQVPMGAGPDWLPDQAAVTAHVKKCAEDDRIGPITDVPVLWDFERNGELYQRVWWEKPESVRPYEDELLEWELKRAKLTMKPETLAELMS
jgi:hypothetical protein